MTHFSTYSELVSAATSSNDQPGMQPYPYQQRIADEGLPDLIEVPTGSGKTLAAVLPWVWRLWHHPDDAIRDATPRRLVLALPTRALTSQTEKIVRRWLRKLELAKDIGVHVLMGGRNDRKTQNLWRIDMHRPTIVICTLDMLVSRMLLRGYGSTRGTYPLDFALMSNGSHIVVDEIQLVPQATATLRQLAAFQAELGTAEPHGLTVMSATVDERILSTVDNPFDEQRATVIALSDEDRVGGLAVRLAGTRLIRELPETSGYKELAAQVLERHTAGTLTLVVLNTVEAATETYRQLVKLKGPEPSLLVHSRFRGVERTDQLDRLESIQESGGIICATQAIEAGVDIDAHTLVTEAAPWPSIVQRAGRCNRAGAWVDAAMWWRQPAKAAPYDAAQVAASQDQLRSVEGLSLTTTDIYELGADIEPEDLALRFLRRRDFAQLFDTTPDLGGSDLDIGVYIRPDQDLDLQLAWVVSDSAPDPNTTIPPEQLRCPVSIPKAVEFLRRDSTKAWVFRPQDDRWVPARGARLRPQDVVLVAASSGGYSAELGFDPSSRTVVDVMSTDTSSTGQIPDAPAATQEPGAASSAWVTITNHLADTGSQADALIGALKPTGLHPDELSAVVVASLLHDLGKAHEDWNGALKAANPAEPPPDDAELYAKSPGSAPLRVKRSITVTTPSGEVVRTEDRVGFRHELVSVGMLSTTEAAELLVAMGTRASMHPLVLYLIGAHHGHLRVSARDPQFDGRDGRTLLGCIDGEPTPGFDLANGHLPVASIDLSRFRGTHSGSWTMGALKLLDEYGPFRLAYLETLVRMADWRASANLTLAGGE